MTRLVKRRGPLFSSAITRKDWGQSPFSPEISAISPHRVVEGGPGFELSIEGVGFIRRSLVRVDGKAVPTRFQGPRLLKVDIPADLVRHAVPNRFSAPGPAQKVGIYGNRTDSIEVYNPPPEGGLSNSIALIVAAK